MNKKEFKMIDTHIHIIPGVDDGAEDFLMAREMLETLVSQGVTGIIATSHSDAFFLNEKKVQDQYGKLNVLIEETKLPIRIHFGCEVYCESELMGEVLMGLRNGTIPTLNGTKYVLTEFYDADMEEALYCLTVLLKEGWIPVIAHAERYRKFNLSFYRRMKALGCLIQMNVFSIGEETNKATKELAMELLKLRLVDFLGSDSHRTTHRPPRVKEGLEWLKKHLDKNYVEEITYKNAERLLLERKEDDHEA